MLGRAQHARCDFEIESRAVLAAEEIDEIFGGIENGGAVSLHSTVGRELDQELDERFGMNSV